MRAGHGLRDLPTHDLEKLLRLTYRGELDFPLTRHGFLVRGLNRIAENADVLMGLDQAGTQAVLVAVIAERRRAESNLPTKETP